MEFNFQITPGAKALYQNGVDFLRAAERCLGMDDNGKVTIVDNGVFRTLAAPAVVNAAFACEMFLKSLINKSGKAYPTGRKGHDLKYLYELLPETVQNFLHKSFDNNCEDTEKRFVNFLETHSNDFVDVRYYVAHEGWQGMSPIMVYTYTYNIGNKTRYLLLNWENVVDG